MFIFSSCTAPTNVENCSAYVSPFIGTGGHGHTFPGAVVPHGMIQPGSDTQIDGWDACPGYYYADSTIDDSSRTHVGGAGCYDHGNVLLMPTVGEQQCRTTDPQSQRLVYASFFSYRNEIAEPGYYSVFLNTYQVKVKVSSAKRGAIHRYTFPENTEFGFIIDLDRSLQRQISSEMGIEVINDTEICGHKEVTCWAFDQYISFYAKPSKPFSYILVTDSITMDNGKRLPVRKALLHFNTSKDEQVLAKMGVSAVDIADVWKNVESEIPGWDFEKVRKDAHTTWSEYLSKIDIATSDKEGKAIFCMAFYHTGISPSPFTDTNGRYLGMDLETHQGDTLNPIYTVFSLWDIFRALHPLMTTTNPDLNNHSINSLVRKHQEGGIYPMWDLVSNYTGTMIGYHAVPIVVDIYMRGYCNFDTRGAYKVCLHTAEYNIIGTKCPDLVLPRLMPKAKYYKNAIGYIPCDRENESVAKALGYTYDDWCISIFAEAMSDFESKAKYGRFIKTYESYSDKLVRFTRGLDSKDEWRISFNPRASTYHSNDYCEGTAWQWTWSMPHDIEGLINLIGEEDIFAQKLDPLFSTDSSLGGETILSDISGLIGQYTHGSEPSHHIIYLYNYVNRPWRTQELVNSVYRSQYVNSIDDPSGSEDCSQMSTWYILNPMGLHQVHPDEPVYPIERPAFDKAVINPSERKTFSIAVKNNGKRNKYIESVSLNGKALNISSFNHQDIANGGMMGVKMTDHLTRWGVLSPIFSSEKKE